MCGLAGIFAYAEQSPPVDRQELLHIRERMRSRGPDGAGFWISNDQRIGLAHRRLAIIDLSDDGAQPMLDPDTGNCIVFNGEIYNYRALRAELESAGYRFRSHSDTEVLLRLYAAHGPEMLHKLRGMYAFAIWDEAKQGLFLARDPFGIKPLYLADDGKTLRFASQVKALLAGGGIDTAAEPAGHVGFFLWGHVPEPYTLYRGIRALPSGANLWLDRARNRSQKTHFNLAEELAHTQADGAIISPQEARAQLRDALIDTVRHHLVADVPVGVFLSAGLDSSTLAALAKEAGADALRTLTLGFKEFAGTQNDEVPLAEAVARHYNADHTTRWVARQDFESRLEALLDAMDQPSIDGVNSYFVSLAAHEAGLKVALSGLGGDELFAGYSDYRDIPRLVRLLGPVARIPGIGRGFRAIAASLLKHLTSPKYAGVLEYGGDYAGAYLLRRGLYMPWELPDVLDADLVREGWRELHTLTALRQSMAGIDDDRLKVSALETAWYMRNQLLRDTDWASMAHSLEVRVPLVDIELFRTVARLVHAGQAPGKQDMAVSPVRPLPAAVLERSKTGFTVPVWEWLMQSGSPSFSSPMRGLRGWQAWIYRNAGQVGA
jgi:asparagine synthase (glutamine-hydrolysing)